ncbi:MAG: sensor histidine kinase, partial [Chitinispirillaceae bacterium]
VLKESDFGDVFGEITFLFEKTVVELQRCIRITAGMNNYAKKNQEEIIEKKNLLDVARNAIELISPDIWNGVDINIDRNESMIWSVNEEDMEKVFYNLFMNSLEAMNGKGRLKVTGYRKHEDLRVIIRDNGPGISRSFLNRVFEPFFTTKECGQKSGMGLTLSSDLVKKFGGDLEIMSNPGKGTTALITFTRSYFPH